MSGIGASLSFERVPTKDGCPPISSRPLQLSRRAASGHDGLNAFPPKLQVNLSIQKSHERSAAQCVPCRNLGDAVSNQPGSQ